MTTSRRGSQNPNYATRFKPGNSGRPKGARNKRTLLLEAIDDGDLEEIRAKLIEAAKEGKIEAAKLILDRLCPPPKARRIEISLPDTSSPQGLTGAIAAVIAAMAAGELDPQEAQQIVGVFETQRRAIETVDLATRIASLEEKAK
jgi:hypothetical protein